MEEQRYTVGLWKGLPQWRCAVCPWDTLEGKAAMLEHLATAHAPKTPRTHALGLVDAQGNPIEVEITEEG